MNKERVIKILKKVINIGIYLGFLLVLIVCIHEKRNFHTDEISTYVLANNTYDETITVNPKWYYTYEDPKQVWMQSMTVQEKEQFNYKNVWEKQASDVHPPFYYIIIHTISSFMPNIFSKWIAGSVNIIFALLTLFVLRKLVMELTKKEWVVFLTSCSFVFSAGILSAATFLRMYVVTMFFIVAISYLFIKGLYERGKKFFLNLFFISVLGTLTHYYFVIYLLFICIIFGLYLIIKKNWKDIGLFILTMVLAGVTTIAIFPSILLHTLGGGYRGEETIKNFIQSDFLSRFKYCYNLVDSQLFGGLFIVVLCASIVLGILGIIIKAKKENFQKPAFIEIYKWVLLWVPVILYFVVISKIAVYLTDRYFHPIYPMLIILFVSTLYLCLEKVLSKKFIFALMAILLVITTFKEFGTNFFYLYRGTQSLLDAAASHSVADCIYIMNAGNEINPSMNEMIQYDSVTFIPQSDLFRLDELSLDTQNGLVVSMGTACKFDLIKEEVQKVWPSLTQYQLLGNHSFSVSYYFY